MIQFQTKLLLLDISFLSQQLFFQLTIRQFDRTSKLIFSEAVYLPDILKLLIEMTEYSASLTIGISAEIRIIEMCSLLQSKAELLLEYFSVGISDVFQICLLVLFPTLIDDRYFYSNCQGVIDSCIRLANLGCICCLDHWIT